MFFKASWGYFLFLLLIFHKVLEPNTHFTLQKIPLFMRTVLVAINHEHTLSFVTI
jgi:hypothetical protein